MRVAMLSLLLVSGCQAGPPTPVRDVLGKDAVAYNCPDPYIAKPVVGDKGIDARIVCVAQTEAEHLEIVRMRESGDGSQVVIRLTAPLDAKP